MRRFIGRTILIVILAALGVMLFYIGKEHSVFFENKTITVDGTEYAPAMTYMVTVDKTIEQKTRKNSKKVAKVPGSKHKIIIKELLDGNEIGKVYEREFSLKVNENALINITAIVNDLDDWIEKTPMN